LRKRIEEMLLANQLCQAVMIEFFLDVFDHVGKHNCHTLFLQGFVDLVKGVGCCEVDVSDGSRFDGKPFDLWIRASDEFEDYLAEAVRVCIVQTRTKKVHSKTRRCLSMLFNRRRLPMTGWCRYH